MKWTLCIVLVLLCFIGGTQLAGCDLGELQKESAAIRRDIEVAGTATPEQIARIQEIDDRVQSIVSWQDAGNQLIGATLAGTPLGLIATIGLGLARRKAGQLNQLVTNVHDAGGVNTKALGILNAGTGLGNIVKKPLEKAKANAVASNSE